MNLLLTGFVLISFGTAVWLSRFDWPKMLALVPVGALVPAYFGTGSNCGAGFVLHLYTEGQCLGPEQPREVFAAFFVLGIGAVLVAAVRARLGRVGLRRRNE